MTTNAERLAEHIRKYGGAGILIHNVPGTPFWLVCQKKTTGWTITLCHPFQEKSYTIGKNISDESHEWLFNELVKIELSRRISTATQHLKNTIGSFKLNG